MDRPRVWTEKVHKNPGRIPAWAQTAPREPSWGSSVNACVAMAGAACPPACLDLFLSIKHANLLI